MLLKPTCATTTATKNRQITTKEDDTFHKYTVVSLTQAYILWHKRIINDNSWSDCVFIDEY